MLVNRCRAATKKNAGYAGVEVRVSRDEFIEWFTARDFAGCHVDRIDNNGHYELGNMQVVPGAVNIAKDKTLLVDGNRRCFKCLEWKPQQEFCKSNRIACGTLTLCLQCSRLRYAAAKVRATTGSTNRK